MKTTKSSLTLHSFKDLKSIQEKQYLSLTWCSPDKTNNKTENDQKPVYSINNQLDGTTQRLKLGYHST